MIATNAVNGCTTSATSTLIFDNINASFDASVYSGLMPLPVTFTNTSFPNPVGTTYTNKVIFFIFEGIVKKKKYFS